MTIPSRWPPEFDGVKINPEGILVRVKGTDVWMNLSAKNKHLSEAITDVDPTIFAWIAQFQDVLDHSE